MEDGQRPDTLVCPVWPEKPPGLHGRQGATHSGAPHQHPPTSPKASSTLAHENRDGNPRGGGMHHETDREIMPLQPRRNHDRTMEETACRIQYGLCSLPPMQSAHDPPTVELIRAAREGDRAALDRLFTMAYDELHHLAHLARRRGAGETLCTTVLVHEAYFKLKPDRGLAIEDRAHFTYIVARAMRQVVVDDARRRRAEKRGGNDLAVTFEDSAKAAPVRSDQVLALEEALERLEEVDPRKAKIVECRFFAGLSVEETAAAMGISTPTVKRDWRVARAWLAQAIA